MDREISPKEKLRRKRKLIIRLVVGVILFFALFILLPKLFEQRLYIENLSIGTVDKGAIKISISASGKLTPLIEEIVTSPLSSRILEVYKNPGDTVQEGEPLLKLELTSLETEYEQKLQEREMRKSKLIQVQVRLDNAISDLQMQKQLKEMNLKQLQSDLQAEKYLDSICADTPDKVRRAELSYEEAKMTLAQLNQKIENERKNAEAELRVQELEVSIFEKAMQEQLRLLNNAQICSPFYGFVSLHELVRSVEALTRTECRNRDIRLNISLPEKETCVYIDGIQFEQVLVNIIENSYEAIGGGGEIRIVVSDAPLTITVVDNGPDISEKVRKKLFTPFFTTKTTGQGVGLMFVREVLNNHHCKFNFFSSNDWTVFKILLE